MIDLPPLSSPPCDAAAFRRDIIENLFTVLGKFPEVATQHDYYKALAYAVRSRLLHRWVHSARTYREQESRTVAYLSAEYLIGPQLGKNLLNLGLLEPAREAVSSLGMDIGDLLAEEEEPGLGNGGLGRLAACFMDSMATLEVPAIGYGIRYEFGLFDQIIKDGWQVEITDKWLRYGNPWEIARPELRFDVKLGGHTESHTDDDGRLRVRWIPERVVRATPHDIPVLGFDVPNANLLRLWSAEATESFDFKAFNIGDYYGAVENKVSSENLSKVLYPNDEPAAGKRLRLEQQYFFVSASLQDMIRIYLQRQDTFERFPEKFVIQLNDTHPAIGIAELMRLLVDEHLLDWDEAWSITTRSFAYTNHTLLPEALETWPLPLFRCVLPRHLQIIFEINRRFLDDVRERFPGNNNLIRRISLIDERGQRRVRMANLACVGSQAINGVARMHSDLLTETVLSDFHGLWPDKFWNVTNGVTPRRFLMLANPGLSALLDEAVGPGWARDLDRLVDLAPFADDASFRKRWREVKLENKRRLSAIIQQKTGIEVDPTSMFDVLVKRIHEYKRQHLAALHIVTLYNRIKLNPSEEIVPRTFLFAGKAAPGYHAAKLIIKLVNCIADVVNNDRDVAGRLKVVFLPDLNVKNAEPIYPAADLSEQISMAGKEASGTGNMKFSMNGALTIGTLDGANVEIREAVGEENFFLFGLTASEIDSVKSRGHRPWDELERDGELQSALRSIGEGAFCPDQRDLFESMVDELVSRDKYMLCADYRSYLDCQQRVSEAWKDEEEWARVSILNVARIGRFSSDRSIADYNRRIWKAPPVEIDVGDSWPADEGETKLRA